MHLLDTTHCSLYLRGAPSDDSFRNSLRFLSVATTTVVAGELFYMANRSAYPYENTAKVEQLLRDIIVFPVTRDCAPKYAEIKNLVINRFGPKDKSKRFKIRIDKLGFSDNDLWIAAVARNYDLTIVSADRGFQRLKDIGVSDLKVSLTI